MPNEPNNPMVEKINENKAAYEELKRQYKICTHFNPHEMNMDDFDVIIESSGVGYAHHKYRVLKNTPRLAPRALAIICDEGNLCYGFRVEGNYIIVHTD